MADSIRETLAKQKAAMSELSAQIKILEENDVLEQNRELTEKYRQLTERYQHTEAQRQALSQENTGLKTALYEQYFSEKAAIVDKTEQQLNIYFGSGNAAEQNHLSRLEHGIKQRVGYLRDSLRRNHVDMQNGIYAKIDSFNEEARDEIARAREVFSQSGSLSAAERAELDCLKNEALRGEQIAALSKKNNIERLVGLRVLNVVGVILIIIGVITAGQFAFVGMSDTMRGISLFALGLVFLIAGEIMNHKRPNIFSLGITAGGIGILYAALAVSFFALGILNMYAALAICVIITAIAFFQSTRYNAQTLLAIALVGGYLPIFSIGPGRALLYGMMVYLVILNLLALSVAFRKKWTTAAFVGLGLNIIGTIYIATLIGRWDPLHERVIETVYIAFAMLIYTAIPLISSYVARIGFKTSDVVLLSINTFFGSLIMFINLSNSGWGDSLGYASAIFAVLYLGIGYAVSKGFPDERAMPALFYITGLTFLVLFVPFHLDSMWFSLGWLVQGTLIAGYGILKNHRAFRISGFIIGGICLACFLTYDLYEWVQWTNNMFPWQYLAITAASVLIMAAYVFKREITGVWQIVYKYCVAANLWFYGLFLVSRLDIILRNTYDIPIFAFNITYITNALIAVATLVLAALYTRLPMLTDKGMKIMSTIMNAFGIIFILILNVTERPIISAASIETQPISIAIIATLILLAIGAIGALAVYDLTRRAVLERVIGVQYLPLAVSAYIVVMLTINLIHVYDLSFASFWISALYVLTALLWTVLGFVKRYAFLRRFGLGLALLSVTKLFIVDLAALTQEWRIVSYFTLGVVLLAISYVYQHFSKRLETGVVEKSFGDYIGLNKAKVEDSLPPESE